MSLYAETIPQLSKMLGNLNNWLDDAVAYGETRGFDPEVLLVARLSPDQFDLTRQIQSACDTAKLTGARLAEVEAPKHEDGPTTIPALKVRIAEVQAFLAGLDADAVDAAEGRELVLPFLRGMAITCPNYVREFALPNFYFHATTAYSILRKNGVKLGKMAFLGGLTLKEPAAS